MKNDEVKINVSKAKEYLALLTTLGAVAATLVNIFITSRLAPVAQDILTLNLSVKAIDNRELEHFNQNREELKRIEESIDKRLERIERKLDAL
jgi:hypothetical protein